MSSKLPGSAIPYTSIPPARTAITSARHRTAVRRAQPRAADIHCPRRARLFEAADFSRFDYVLAMDRENFAYLESLAAADTGIG